MIADRTAEARAFVEGVVAEVPLSTSGPAGGAEWSGAAVDVPTAR